MLSDVPLFRGLCEQDLATLESHAARKHYRRNTVLMERGDVGHVLYVVLSGRLKVYVSDDQGKEVVLNELEPSDYVGELALLSDVPRSASVSTMTDATLLALAKPDFKACLTGNPSIAWNLITALAERTRKLTDIVGDLALMDVYGRLTKLLNQSAEECDGRYITPAYTHQELADRIAASREMVTKILKDLRQGGYVSSEGRHLVIERKLPMHW